MPVKYFVALLSVGLILSACTEENEDAQGLSYTATSLTCDGQTTSLNTNMVLTMTFNPTSTLLGLAGVTATEVCSGAYVLTGVDFADDTSFTFTRPDAANACVDIEGSQVASCDVGGVSCDTTAAGSALTTAGTYTQSEDQLVLTYTSTGQSFCPNGEEEVLTLTNQ
jgi:hypothetical protein